MYVGLGVQEVEKRKRKFLDILSLSNFDVISSILDDLQHFMYFKAFSTPIITVLIFILSLLTPLLPR